MNKKHDDIDIDTDELILAPAGCLSKDILENAHSLNKYDYGHIVIYGGAEKTGAACLAAMAALRMGCGLVSIVSRAESLLVYKSYAPEFMVEHLDEPARFVKHIEDERRSVVLIGPGAGLENRTVLRKAVMDALRFKDKVTVLDADALSVIADDPAPVFKLMHANTILTPHKGEFDRLFPQLAGLEPAEAAIEASKLTGAYVVLKTGSIHVGMPDGNIYVSHLGSPWLATGGTGDVLAGALAGMAGWKAHKDLSAAIIQAVWMYGYTSQMVGKGLIASDLLREMQYAWGSL